MNNSPAKGYQLPTWIKNQGLTEFFFHRGPSMVPTFRAGDILFVRPGVQGLKPGDVILFKIKGEEDNTVHRIVTLAGKEYITRGDANLRNDPMSIPLADVIGQVELMERGGKYYRITEGVSGLIQAKIQWSLLDLTSRVKNLLLKPYRALGKSGLVPKIWKPTIDRISLQEEGRVLIKYLHHQRTVATWEPSSQRFRCDPPFDLVIPYPLQDESAQAKEP